MAYSGTVCTCGHASDDHQTTPAGPICQNANRCGCLGFDPKYIERGDGLVAVEMPTANGQPMLMPDEMHTEVDRTWSTGRRQISLQSAYAQILQQTEGKWREGTEDTPGRAARAWCEMTAGYAVDIESLMTMFDADGYDEMVIVKSSPVWSLCEHHLLPFHGVAHVGYVPRNSIVGLSKIPRIVDAFSRRLQVQERLTSQIADTLDTYLNPKGVIVVVEATHLCMAMRGVGVSGSVTKTSAVRGVLKDKPEARAEALNLIGANP